NGGGGGGGGGAPSGWPPGGGPPGGGPPPQQNAPPPTGGGKFFGWVVGGGAAKRGGGRVGGRPAPRVGSRAGGAHRPGTVRGARGRRSGRRCVRRVSAGRRLPRSASPRRVRWTFPPASSLIRPTSGRGRTYPSAGTSNRRSVCRPHSRTTPTRQRWASSGLVP